MGRLQALSFVALVAPIAIADAGCDRSAAAIDPPKQRSESITAGDAAPIAPAPEASGDPANKHAMPAAPARKLCDGELARAPRRLPKTTFTPVAAPGAAKPAKTLPTGAGKWTWINFFAAWCGPCKEEMPRLRAFQQKLAADMDVAFVSLDDDARQLDKFLGDQPDTGVKSALWLQPKPRSAWLTALGLKDPPDLPAHVLVDRAGKVRCTVEGAVVESDFATIESIVKQ